MQQYPVNPVALKTAHEWISVERCSDRKDIVDLADVVGFPKEHPWLDAYKNRHYQKPKSTSIFIPFLPKKSVRKAMITPKIV